MKSKMRSFALAALLAAVTVGASLASARDENPQVTPEEQTALAAGNAAFALEMYQRLQAGSDENLFFSPYSISQALGMTYAGARNETAAQMAAALHFDLPPDRLHPTFNALDLALASRSQGQGEEETGDRFRLNVANSIWVQRDYSLLPGFVATLTDHYGAEPFQVDYVNATEDARLQINGWVAQRTEDRIRDLLGPGILTPDTRLVLTNAIYFNASWADAFQPSATRDEPFHRLDGSSAPVPMMHRTAELPYASGDGWAAVSLPYLGNALSMVVLLPDEGRFQEIEDGLTAEGLVAMLAAMRRPEVALGLPRFRMEGSFSLADLLAAQGMPIAFEPGSADFSGMADVSAPGENLYISAVIHKAFVAVDESGTEAAAATAVVMAREGAAIFEPDPPVPFVADRPFIVIVRDDPTGTILFLGRVMNPAP